MLHPSLPSILLGGRQDEVRGDLVAEEGPRLAEALRPRNGAAAVVKATRRAVATVPRVLAAARNTIDLPRGWPVLAARQPVQEGRAPVATFSLPRHRRLQGPPRPAERAALALRPRARLGACSGLRLRDHLGGL